ncbi:hypothetical protein KPLM21_750002 [Klebsiella pneumoniae]|nr:hypothetical protein KPLM21_750002 [Klebsiella pneumoniae]
MNYRNRFPNLNIYNESKNYNAELPSYSGFAVNISLTLACLPNYSIHGITDEVHFIFNIVIPVSFIIMIGNCI